MLTRELAIAEFDKSRIVPDRLSRPRHSRYVALMDRALELYRNGIGRARSQLHQGVHQVFANELDCPVRRIDAFCKLLDERGTFDRDRRGRAAKLRKQVFRAAGRNFPLVQTADRLFESDETEIKQAIARELGKSWIQVEHELFADVFQFHRLTAFAGYTDAHELLARYNVAQCQAVLYDAIAMMVWSQDDFKTIVRYAKLARLMHTIERKPDGSYLFRFDGPVSVLRQSRRYGVALARFLPALLSCRDWRMQARIQHRRASWQNTFHLSPADGLRSAHPDPTEFDSRVEEDFFTKWGAGPREGWTLIREGEVLHRNQKVFVPDFVFRHEKGKSVLMEVVGFWTPEYLEAKRKSLDTFRDHHIILAIADSVDWPARQECRYTIRYKSVIRVPEVLALLRHGSPDVDSQTGRQTP